MLTFETLWHVPCAMCHVPCGTRQDHASATAKFALAMQVVILMECVLLPECILSLTLENVFSFLH
jgi:hypothetical protein